MHAQVYQTKEKNNPFLSANLKKDKSTEAAFQFVDNRPNMVTQMKFQQMANNSHQVMQLKSLGAVIQLAGTSVTNSKGDTYTVYQPSDIISDLTARFRQWKNGTVNTSGHGAGQSKHILASKYNTLANLWNRRNDKTAGKSVITFSTGGSLSGGRGVKHLKAVTFEGGKRYSFVWHVSVVPD